MDDVDDLVSLTRCSWLRLAVNGADHRDVQDYRRKSGIVRAELAASFVDEEQDCRWTGKVHCASDKLLSRRRVLMSSPKARSVR